VGTIPSSLSRLSSLVVLFLAENSLTGSIPPCIGNLTALQHIGLFGNLLTSSLPSSFQNLQSLSTLDMGRNQFTSTLPDWLGELESLEVIFLGVNLFTGTIPSNLFNLIQLNTLYIDFNHLTGSVPVELGDLTLLKYFACSLNMLTGTIPSSLSQMTSIMVLLLNYNSLTGSVVDIFKDLSYLSILELDNNLLTGTIPTSISKLPLLNRLFVQNNYLSGNLEGVFNGSLQQILTNVQLSSNQFTGELPEQLFLSSSLLSVSAVSNCFHGTIPSSICLNKNLVTLALDGLVCASSCRNKIFPSISSSYISSRSITGGIPSCVWTMPSLVLLHLSGNSLTGSMSSITIPHNSTLRDLTLSHNLFTGSISDDIQNAKWKMLDLSHNRLTGSIQSSFNSTSSRSALRLNNNRLSGTIPSTIHHMDDIYILESGYFGCKYDRSDLPLHDSYRAIYDCGSNTLNVAFYIWMGLLAIAIIVVWMLVYFREALDNNFRLSKRLTRIHQWLNIATYLSTSNEVGIEAEVRSKFEALTSFHRYMELHRVIRVVGLWFTVFIIVILLPTYVSLSVYYRTHTYEYAWIMSIIFLSGETAFAVALVVLVIFVVVQVIMSAWISRDSEEVVHHIGDDKQPCSINNSSIGVGVDADNGGGCGSRKMWSVYVTYTMINLVVVGGVNTAYVVIALNESRPVIILSQVLSSYASPSSSLSILIIIIIIIIIRNDNHNLY